MVITTNKWAAHANTRFQIPFASIPDDDGNETDLQTRVVRVAACRFNASGVPEYDAPVLNFASTDAAPPGEANPQVYIENPITGDPRVVVTILPANTSSIVSNSEVVLYVEVEVEEADGSAPVVIATGTLTLWPNVNNA